MTIPENVWIHYIDAMREINNTAAQKMAAYLETHPYDTYESMRAAIDYGYALATKYGEGAAELACEMYDQMSAIAGMMFPSAEPAATATIHEVAKALNGAKKFSQDVEVLASVIGRLVKTAGVDTTMQNAIRDGAEWAWIPHGDTCAFCITLASRGWHKATPGEIKDGHAAHIHANCDCTYAVRFNEDTDYAGYDPARYEKMYYNAPLDGQKATGTNRINAMRREMYAANKDEINAQKRAAYQRRKQTEEANV